MDASPPWIGQPLALALTETLWDPASSLRQEKVTISALSGPYASQADLRRGDRGCRSKCCASSSRGLIADVRCRTDVVVG